MSDELERQLDEFYGSLDEPARRVQARLKASTPRPSRARRTPPLAWFAAAVASAAAAALVIFSLLPQDRTPLPEPAIARRIEPAPALTPPPVSPEKRPETKPATAPPPAPRSESLPDPPAPKPAPEPPTPRPEPPRPAAPDEPKKPAPKAEPTRVERVAAMFTETRGSFELGKRRIRAPQQELVIAGEQAFRAGSGVVRLALAKNRFLLVRARSRLNLVPRTDRLEVVIESGEVLAELLGPGPEIRIVTPTCEVTPLGTVFDVRVDRGRTVILVEESRVACRVGDKSVEIPAGHGLVVGRKGVLGTPKRADFRALAWTKAHRPAVLPLFVETFDAPGKWDIDLEAGAARGRKDAKWGISRVDLIVNPPKPPIFRVPVRGRIVVTCRFERSAKLIVQLGSTDRGTNFRLERPVTAPGKWQTVSLDFAEFFPTLEEHRPATLFPGERISALSVHAEYGADVKRFWVDSVRVEALR